MYTDVWRITRMALERGEITLNFPTPSAAKYFRVRFYHYRKLLQTAGQGDSGRFNVTDLDGLILNIQKTGIGQYGVDTGNLIIRTQQLPAGVTITDTDGNQLNVPDLDEATPTLPDTPVNMEDDALLEQALAAKTDLGFGKVKP